MKFISGINMLVTADNGNTSSSLNYVVIGLLVIVLILIIITLKSNK